MRDAFVASLTLDIFHKYTDRVKMTNIAQIANVLHSMILTEGDKMVLTPTYYVFKMYNVHQDAVYLPLDLQCERRIVRDNRILPMISATASRDKAGKIHVSLSNVDLENGQEVTVKLDGISGKSVSGCILTSGHIGDCNTFDKPDAVALKKLQWSKDNERRHCGEAPGQIDCHFRNQLICMQAGLALSGSERCPFIPTWRISATRIRGICVWRAF